MPNRQYGGKGYGTLINTGCACATSGASTKAAIMTAIRNSRMSTPKPISKTRKGHYHSLARFERVKLVFNRIA